MIWADQTDRIELFRKAVALVRTAPPRLVGGDAIEALPGLVERAPPGALTCVLHSHAIYQMSRAWRERFERQLADLGRMRALAQISFEWLGDDPGPQLHLTDCTGAERPSTHLADCDHHGRWIHWLAG